MKVKAKVTWVNDKGQKGSGTIISELYDDLVLVCVDAPKNMEHGVICCSTTWLTEVKA